MAIFVIFVDVCLLFDLLVIGSRMLVFGFYELDKVYKGEGSHHN